MTEMRFDDDATAPKLYFRPVRALDEDELKAAIELRDSDEAKKAIEFTVAQTDGGAKKSEEKKPAAKKPAAKKAEVEDEPDESVEEPKKVEKAAKKEVVETKSTDALADVLAEWDD